MTHPTSCQATRLDTKTAAGVAQRVGAERLPRLSALALGVLVLGSAWGAGTVDVGEVSGLPGSDVRLSVFLEADSPIVAGEFEVIHSSPYLELQPAQTGAAAAAHKVQSAVPSAGRQRVVFYSLSNAELRRGAVVDLRLRLQPSAPDVTAAVTLTNVVLVTAAGTTVQPLELKAGAASIAALRFDAVERLAGNLVRLQLRGRSEQRYVVQTAPTPEATTWSNLSTNVATNGVIQLQDIVAGAATGRFYRATAAP